MLAFQTRLIAAFVLVIAALYPSGAPAYAPVEDALPPKVLPGKSIRMSPTSGEKSSIPDKAPLPSNGQGSAPTDGDDEIFDGHGSASEASDVPEPSASQADISYDVSALPEPVQATRELLIEAARTGDIEALRPVFARQTAAPVVAPFDSPADPVEFLRLQSGDDAGREILAILIELLESGHVTVGEGGRKTFVWPYFAEVPLHELSDKQFVEVYRILTAVDVEEIERIGGYTFFRVGIAPDGRLRYFTAGALE